MGAHNVSWKATRQIGCPHFCVEVQGNAELGVHVLYCGRSGVLAGCPHNEIGHPRGFVGTQIFAWTVTCLAWAPICCVWTPKAYGWAPIVMRWMSTCCCWVSTNMRWVATCRLCAPRFMGGKPRDYCAHPLRLRVDPQKIGNFHALEVHTRPPSSTHSHNSPRECCVVPRVLCASPRVLRACPSVPSVLCGRVFLRVYAHLRNYVRPRNRATKNPLPKGERTFGARR